MLLRKPPCFLSYKPQLRSWRSSQKKNHLLESSLFNVNSELEGLRIKSKILEDSCLLFDHEKSSLTSDKEMLVSQLNITHQTLKDLGKKHSELELKHLELKGKSIPELCN